MINIMHVIDTRGSGGAESVYLDLINELPRDQFFPSLLYLVAVMFMIN